MPATAALQRNWIWPLTLTVMDAVPDSTATGAGAASAAMAIMLTPRVR